MDEGFGLGEAQRVLFEIGDGDLLFFPEALGGNGGHFAEPGAEGFFFLDHFAERLGAVEGKDIAAARMGLEPVGELCDLAGGFVLEGKWATPSGELGGEAVGVAGGLTFDTFESVADGLGFDDADGFGVYIEEIVGFAVGAGELGDGETGAGGEVHLVICLDDPAGCF